MDTATADRGRSGDGCQGRAATYARWTTDDRDEAEQVITELYLPNRLDLSQACEPLDMRVAGLRLGSLTAGRLTYGRAVGLRTADAEGLHVNLPLRGRADSRRGAGDQVTTGPGEALVFSPGAPAEMFWSGDCEQLCLMVPQARVESELEQLTGRPLGGRLSFDFAADLGSPMASPLRTALGLLAGELEHPTELSGHAHAVRHLEGLVLDGLLLGLRHSHSGALAGDQRGSMRATIRHAVQLMEEQPAQPWTTVRLATEVHLSVRALQEGFHRDLNTPPMAYLRRVRLRRAHEALLAAGHDTTTVRAVALGLGIVHMSRFAAAYREAFGETPSQTLRRTA